MKIFKILFFLFWLPAKMMAQEIQINPEVFPPGQQFSNFISMTQDKNGYIWIVDNNGKLLKYDGKRIYTYIPKKDGTNSMVTGRGECVHTDKSGNIWYGSFANGMDKLDLETGEFSHFKLEKNNPNSIISNSIRAILEDSEGMIWIGTLNGVDRYDPATKKFVHISNQEPEAVALSKEHVRTIYEDRAGTIWVGCGSAFQNETPKDGAGGLYKINKKTDKITRYANIKGDNNSLIDNKIRAVYEDSRGTFWVGTAGDGLHTLDRATGKFTRHHYDPKSPNKLSRPAIGNSLSFVEDHITFINEDYTGCIWIGTMENGLNRYNPKTNSLNHYGPYENEPFRINQNQFWCSLKTKDNVLWISSWGSSSNDKMLHKVIPRLPKLDYSQTNTSILSFFQSKKGELWLGTNQGLMLRKNTGNNETYTINPDSAGLSAIIGSIDKGANNDIWLASLKGLHQFDLVTKRVKTFIHDPKNPNSIASDMITGGALMDESGKLWVGTFRGLDIMDINTGTFKHFVLEDEQTEFSNGIILTLENTENRVQALLKDSKSDIWVGLRNTLQMFDKKKGKFKTYLSSNARVRCMYEDKLKNIWIGTDQGFYKYNAQNDQVEPYYDDIGLITDITSVYGIIEDKPGNLWLNTGDGILKLDPKNKNSVLFGRNWGINTTNLNNDCFITLENEITVGDINGYFHFSPEDISSFKVSAPQPFINKFILGKEPLIAGSELLPLELSETNTITLPFNKNSFTIEFNNIDFINFQDQKNILFKLENYDEQWRKAESENKAVYYNLKVGEYLFKVKTINILGEWGEKTLKIIILPPWYKRWWAYLIFTLLGASILQSYIIFRSKKLKKENKLLEEKINERTSQLKKSLEDLKSTQSQLIQSEKMASLGELTAGIAHEIQNPLNFVNNFSEMNKELLEEMNDEIGKGNFDEVKAIAIDVIGNEEKINHHGRRASDIVKGMLEHSRKSTREKESTDINALCDEYLRLAYHGMKAKDNDFNATMETHFDPNLPKINVIPQDIGRVLLNLINNAYYAVNERDKKGETGYQPTVSITTTRVDSPLGLPADQAGVRGELGKGDYIQISIKDNGSGIPAHIKDKIFQPFFTTKPTGQGTGLGLSLSYDIVKAHGGEIKVNTREIEDLPTGYAETEFIIQIPAL